jgi:hypothetical protein
MSTSDKYDEAEKGGRMEQWAKEEEEREKMHIRLKEITPQIQEHLDAGLRKRADELSLHYMSQIQKYLNSRYYKKAYMLLLSLEELVANIDEEFYREVISIRKEVEKELGLNSEIEN